MRYTYNAGSNNDTSSLWVDPALGLVLPPTPNLTVSDSSVSDEPMDTVAFATGIGSQGTVEADELRLATSWLEVTPTAPAAATNWEYYD